MIRLQLIVHHRPRDSMRPHAYCWTWWLHALSIRHAMTTSEAIYYEAYMLMNKAYLHLRLEYPKSPVYITVLVFFLENSNKEVCDYHMWITA